MTTFSHDQFLHNDDYGFTFVDENDFIDKESHGKIVEGKDNQKIDVQTRLDKLYNAIMPFLNNLQKNGDKPYLNWPDRARKVQDFKTKLESIYKGVAP